MSDFGQLYAIDDPEFAERLKLKPVAEIPGWPSAEDFAAMSDMEVITNLLQTGVWDWEDVSRYCGDAPVLHVTGCVATGPTYSGKLDFEEAGTMQPDVTYAEYMRTQGEATERNRAAFSGEEPLGFYEVQKRVTMHMLYEDDDPTALPMKLFMGAAV